MDAFLEAVNPELTFPDTNEAKEGIDAEITIDALYSPFFYRLLLKHQPLTKDFVARLVDVVMNGLIVNSESNN